eukprot:CAMPEP_0181370344 /NCGR_PEP_ID=MMETSP1106-20121128/13367_1 /TAXON_ID=81844 /ORGANISM="Mantoniella antarctica, Strain SL-175" /LENGTH=145 /DNA_ID=CAMNT_0023487113 /DNA_START=892 /DNA_END=1330 /DNA_ORIENTATION=+
MSTVERSVQWEATIAFDCRECPYPCRRLSSHRCRHPRQYRELTASNKLPDRSAATFQASGFAASASAVAASDYLPKRTRALSSLMAAFPPPPPSALLLRPSAPVAAPDTPARHVDVVPGTKHRAAYCASALVSSTSSELHAVYPS